MKKYLLLLAVAMLCPLHTILSQNNISDKDRYDVLRHEVVVYPIDFLTKEIKETPIVLYDDVVFEQLENIEKDGEKYKIIKAIQYVKKRRQKATKDRPLKGVEIDNYYVIKTTHLAAESNNIISFTPKTWELRAGVANIPVKFYLPDDGDALDFSSRSVSLGTTIGAAQQVSNSRRNLWVNYLLGAQFTMVTRTSDDFLNFDGDDGNSNTLSAFSLSLGIALDFEGIEVGVFLGKDYLPGSAAANWKHNGDLWFSIGVGTSLTGGKGNIPNVGNQ